MGWAFLAPNTFLGVSGDTVIVVDISKPELQFLSGDGKVTRRQSLPLPRPADLSLHRDAALKEGLAQAGPQDNKAYILASHEATRPPLYYRDLVVALDGHLWVRLFETRPGERVPYLILNPAGVVRGRVSLPPGSRILSVQTPWITYVLADADGVERLGLARWAVP